MDKIHPLNFNPIILSYKEGNNFGRLLDMDFEIFGAGKLEYKLKINKSHLATPFASHGGLVSALMDSVLGICALSLVCEEGKIVSTIEMKLNFLAPVKLGDYLLGKANLLNKGNRIICIEGEILNQNEVLVAKGMGTFNAYPKEKAGY
jgi:uncharacterized protein (TIGR00369 family)